MYPGGPSSGALIREASFQRLLESSIVPTSRVEVPGPVNNSAHSRLSQTPNIRTPSNPSQGIQPETVGSRTLRCSPRRLHRPRSATLESAQSELGPWSPQSYADSQPCPSRPLTSFSPPETEKKHLLSKTTSQTSSPSQITTNRF